MVKKIVAALLIIGSAGAWFYLDQLNQQALQAAEESRKVIDQARARTKMQAAAKAKFEEQISADLKSCKEQAAKAKVDFLAQPRKKSKQKAAVAEADKTLESANAACQATYDGRLAQGQ